MSRNCLLILLRLHSIMDCMEVFSKGIHRALVPLDGNMENIAGVELVESASSYRMLTQMDLIRFLKGHESELKHITDRTLHELGVIVEPIFGVTNHTKVIDAIRSMRAGALNAIPIVESINPATEDHSQLVNVIPLLQCYLFVSQFMSRFHFEILCVINN